MSWCVWRVCWLEHLYIFFFFVITIHKLCECLGVGWCPCLEVALVKDSGLLECVFVCCYKVFLLIKKNTTREREREVIQKMEITNEREDDIVNLYNASTNGYTATLKSLIDKDPHILYIISSFPFSETSLHISAELGNLHFTKTFLT